MTFNLGRRFAIYSVEDGTIVALYSGEARHAAGQCREGQAVTPISVEVRSDTHRIDPATGLSEFLPPSEPSFEEVLAIARAHRDRLLTASDWTQSPDNRLNPEQREAWRIVREEWRGRIDDIKAGVQPRPWAEEPSGN